MKPIDEEIREIRKEIVESRSLTIKNNNLVQNLNGDIKQISRVLEQGRISSLINSWVAYLLFVALLGGGALYVVRTQGARTRHELETARTTATAAERRANDLEAVARRRGEEDEKALRVVRALRAAGKDRNAQQSAVQAYASLDRSLLSKSEVELLDGEPPRRRVRRRPERLQERAERSARGAHLRWAHGRGALRSVTARASIEARG